MDTYKPVFFRDGCDLPPHVLRVHIQLQRPHTGSQWGGASLLVSSQRQPAQPLGPSLCKAVLSAAAATAALPRSRLQQPEVLKC